MYKICSYMHISGQSFKNLTASYCFPVYAESQSDSELPFAQVLFYLYHILLHIFTKSVLNFIHRLDILCPLAWANIYFLVSLTFSWRAKSWYGWECRWWEGTWWIYLFNVSSTSSLSGFMVHSHLRHFTHQQFAHFGFFLVRGGILC